MDKYLTIKEFSRLSGVEQTTLRYWDDIGLFSPSKRDPDNNYRYYSSQQIIAVNFITVLSELNIPLKTIGEVEKERTPEKIERLIAAQEVQLNYEMRKLRERYSIIHTRRELINYGIKVQEDKIDILQKEARPFILGPRNSWEPGEAFYKYFIDFCSLADELRINLSFPIGSYHDDMESFLKAPGEPDYFYSIDPTGNRKMEAGKYLVGYARGYYGEFGDLNLRMKEYGEKHKLAFHGPVYTMYLFDETCLVDPDQYLAQVCVAVL